MSNKIILHTAKGACFFAAEEIVWLEADGNYVWVHFLTQKPLLLAKVLKEFEPALLPLCFFANPPFAFSEQKQSGKDWD